jgi:hypothetical protein
VDSDLALEQEPVKAALHLVGHLDAADLAGERPRLLVGIEVGQTGPAVVEMPWATR